MKNNKLILKFQIISTIFVIAAGILLHFTFEWTNENIFAGIFSAVNESTWEHLKLVFFPMLITTIAGYYLLGDNIICAKTIGAITAMLLTVVLFYTYTGIIGTNYASINIGIFIIAVVIGEYIAYRIMKTGRSYKSSICTIILILLAISFVIFTYNTPKINLFKDPVTGRYGI